MVIVRLAKTAIVAALALRVVEVHDLAVGLHVTPPEAEWVKCHYGHAVVTAVPQLNEIELTHAPLH